MSDGDVHLQPMAAWAAWQRLVGQLGIGVAHRAQADALGQRLARCYQGWPRRYHTLGHLLACLHQAGQWRAQLNHAEAVDFALWFHDAIYRPWRRDNEARSARWAQASALRLGLGQPFADEVHALVMATAHLASNDGGHGADASQAARGDTDWLVDIDLSILGEAPEVYDGYEAAVRSEYFFIPRKSWRAGRGAVLRHFLGLPAIFRTPAYRQRFEARARANLARSLARLEAD